MDNQDPVDNQDAVDAPGAADHSSLVMVHIPQIGEGLLEARITARLIPQGDPVTRDEPLLEIETDKATVIIEAPASGILHRWEMTEGATLPVGAVVASIQTGPPSDEEIRSQRSSGSGSPSASPVIGSLVQSLPQSISGPQPTSPAESPPSVEPRNRLFSPRVRAYCREHSIGDDELFTIPAARDDGRLQVSDVEAWLSDGDQRGGSQDRPLTPRQRALAQRLTRSWQQAVPASIEIEFNWDSLQRAKVLAARETTFKVSSLDLIAWCVTQSMANHPKLRSALVGDYVLREYRHVHVGIAVALPGDELTVAVLQDADCLPLPSFIQQLHEVIESARQGSTPGAAQLTISKMSSYGVRTAQAVVVPPAIATLVIGAPYTAPYPGEDGSIRWRQTARLILTFDHRILNGVGAATFLRDVQRGIGALPVG